MLSLNLPVFDTKINVRNGKNVIFDVIRKRYVRDLSARMIVEYKAPHIEITQTVFDQITRYNMVLKVDYLIVSNGMQHYCCRMDYEHQSYIFLQDIPDYNNL